MTDQELARALFEAGLLTQEQVQTAAAQRAPNKNFAQTVVQLGWVTPAQIAQFDPNALNDQAATTPLPMPTAPPTSGPWQSGTGASAAASYGAPAGGGNPGATVDLSAIGEAWQLVQAQLGTWVAAILIFLVVSVVSAIALWPHGGRSANSNRPQ